MDVMVAYIESCGESCSYRELDDYFHFKHSYLLDRMEIIELLEELYTTGQLLFPLSSASIPSDYREVHDIAQKLVWKELRVLNCLRNT